MRQSRKTFYLDAAERVLWTAAQAGLGAVAVAELDIPPAYGVLVAAGLAVLKAFVASHVGVQDSASTVPSV